MTRVGSVEPQPRARPPARTICEPSRAALSPLASQWDSRAPSTKFEGLTHPQAFSSGIVVSNDDNKSRTTNYWPSSPSYSTTTTSPTTTTKNDAFRSGRHQRDDAARGLQIVSVPGAGRLGVQVLTGRGSDPERDNERMRLATLLPHSLLNRQSRSMILAPG
jgi:hypothetical protein